MSRFPSNFNNFSRNFDRRLNPNAREFLPRQFGRGRGNFARELDGETARNSGNGNNENLRTTLSDRLQNEIYECMICCDRVRCTHSVWSCQLCFSVFHLRCVKKWASSCTSTQQDGPSAGALSEWRCPGCQSVSDSIPNEYKCFCGKMKNPQRGHLVPHSCGELCQKRKSDSVNGGCPHPCNLLCHPGPCELCPRTVDKRCVCGKESRRVRCGSEDFQCGVVCGKLLNCNVHFCQRTCHAGNCDRCDEELAQNCFCGRSQRQILCGGTATSKYSCGSVCDKPYSCGFHHCARPCHEGECGACPFDPSVVKGCCCGKKSLGELSIVRSACSDPMPVCGGICEKSLTCGETDNRHVCKATCHPGACPVCPLNTPVRCRCGSTMKSVACAELGQDDGEHQLLCDRRCNKKRTCKQHKCGEVCCVDTDHLCTQICGKKLTCGVHACDSLCHGGKCRPCLQASFDELTCFCGASVIYPPVRCGTKPPACDKLCTRQHTCQHPVTHNCHSDAECPPCTFLTEKLCYGKHEVRKNIPCYLNDVSCGRACGKPLPCGQHSCVRTCHAGVCFLDGELCTQMCVRPRPACGHPCGIKCHGDSACPDDKRCEFIVKVTCKCGHVTGTMACYEIDRLELNKFLAKASKADAKNDVNLAGLEHQNSVERYKCLDCTDECARVERNRRFVEALNINTDDLTGDVGPPSYTDFLKEQFKVNAEFVLGIEKTLCDLVSNADKSKQPSRSHVFAPMNRNQRRIIYEYAGYLDIDTVAYDQEPKRNVVATAERGKSKIPTILLSTVVQKENTKSSNRVVPPKASQVETGVESAKMKTLQLSGRVLRR